VHQLVEKTLIMQTDGYVPSCYSNSKRNHSN